jgi:oligopeptide/dipeptide ABC transporter ATP-binding protein
MTRVLQVENLRISFPDAGKGRVYPVDGVSFTLERGKTLALVGESGCGKSLTSLALLRLVPDPGRIEEGSAIRLGDADVLALKGEALRRIRGRRIGMIFQDPMTSLNPVFTVGDQIAEGVRAHFDVSKAEARGQALALLREVGIPDPEARLEAYPHQLSGGMRQRVMIAMALLCKPQLLIADEPTTALDVTIQAQILQILLSLRESEGLSIILITHDLAVVSSVADRVVVMYAGTVVEEAPARQLFSEPAHPYTQALLRSLPAAKTKPGARLQGIDGFPPHLDQGPFTACRFLPRCDQAVAACEQGQPPLVSLGPKRKSRCVLTPEGSGA